MSQCDVIGLNKEMVVDSFQALWIWILSVTLRLCCDNMPQTSSIK
jgi:hypothetical protein